MSKSIISNVANLAGFAVALAVAMAPAVLQAGNGKVASAQVQLSDTLYAAGAKMVAPASASAATPRAQNAS